MNTPKYPDLFPIGLGNEEETMLMTGPGMDALGDPTEFVGCFEDYLPASPRYTNSREAFFLSNGSMLYDGGSSVTQDPVNLERTTPECASPREVATYVQANEDLLVTMLGNYVIDTLYEGRPEVARSQRRVVDNEGNTRGCHDNFEMRQPGWIELLERKQQKQLEDTLLTHLETRSFMTGAGYVNSYGLHFGQKVAHITALNKYNFINSAFRFASMLEDTGPRAEIRCNDINISPWAVQARVGGAALYLTALQTPLLEKLEKLVPNNISPGQHLRNFRLYNYVNMSDDWQLQASSNTIRALDFQERIWELCDTELDNYVPLDQEYRDLITEMRYYCEDFRKVLAGELDFTVLANRSDMAAKFALMKKSAEKAGRYGVSRSVGHVVFQAMDMRYDTIQVSADDRGRRRTQYGYGYRLRDKGAFRLGLKDRDVQRAFYQPPETTRAKIRGALIKAGMVEHCQWNNVSLVIPTIEGDKTILSIPLTKVLMPKDEINEAIRHHAAAGKATK